MASFQGWAAISSDEGTIAQQLATTAPFSVALDAGKLQVQVTCDHIVYLHVTCDHIVYLLVTCDRICV